VKDLGHHEEVVRIDIKMDGKVQPLSHPELWGSCRHLWTVPSCGMTLPEIAALWGNRWFR